MYPAITFTFVSNHTFVQVVRAAKKMHTKHLRNCELQSLRLRNYDGVSIVKTSLPSGTMILWPSERNVYLSKAFSVLKNEEKWIGAVAMYKIFRDCGTLLFEIQFLLLQLYYYTKRSWVDVIANEWTCF